MSVALAPLAEHPGCIGATIITRGRTYFDFENPEGSAIDIQDIAAGLARTCRYGGQLPDDVPIYTVAQHSVLVSHVVPAPIALAGLLHDSAEAYMGDLPSPLKRLLPEFKVLEKRVEAAIFARFGLPREIPSEVKDADYRLLSTEKRDIQRTTDAWPGLERYPPLDETIAAWSIEYSRFRFLQRFYELTGEALV